MSDVDTTRLARKMADRADKQPVMWSWGQVKALTSLNGTSTIDVQVGEAGYDITYPFVRYDAGMAPVVGEKVALIWMGTDPYAFSKPAV